MTARERVLATLEFRNDSRVPRDLWILPWTKINCLSELETLENHYPTDILRLNGFYSRQMPSIEGERYTRGMYRDEWGCVFTNLEDGLVGQVRDPISTEEDWEELPEALRVPTELLELDVERINTLCEQESRFVLGSPMARPFERLQYIRGTEQLLIDLMERQPGLEKTLQVIHDFYCKSVEAWCRTKVDGVWFLDDWGTQLDLIISPELWREMFKPLYAEYVRIIHSYGKKAFFHCDGNIERIYPDLIEIGIDAVNSQLFCMDIEALKVYRGKITFWGEIDRQYILAFGTPEEAVQAVRKVYENLWDRGGCIAQCEFALEAKAENVQAVFEEWNRLTDV